MRPVARASFTAASLLGLVSLVAGVAACGSSTGSSSDFLTGEPTESGSGSSANGDADGGASSATGSGGSGSSISLTPTSSSGGGASSDGGVNASCNAVSATATLAPVRLVVMLDRSGSMGKFTDQNGAAQDNTAVRWTPVTTALRTFFEDAASTNVEASLQFFPLGNASAQCSSDTYATPSVDFTSLPVTASSDPFAAQIALTSPNGGTPTIEALAGALTYAVDSMKTDSSGARYAVVFVTDGDPCSCSAGPQAGCPGFVGSTQDTAAAQQVASLAAQYAAEIPTYVIGVGTDFDNLNLIAQGGGTTSAIGVSTETSPAQTSSDLLSALDSIRKTTVSCDFVIPAAPTGQTYDIDAVNVQYTPSGGTASTLPYDPTCSDSSGWHYDNPSAPTQIVLCGSTCSAAQSGDGAKVNVAFGCDTVGGIPGYDGGVVVR